MDFAYLLWQAIYDKCSSLLTHPSPSPSLSYSSSHSVVGGPAASLGTDPVDVLLVVLDITGLAVDAVLRVDHQPHAVLPILAGNKLIHA